MNVHLVDGTWELFRAYYGAPKRRAPDGREIGATRQLMLSLTTLLGAPEVTHVAVAFDTVIESFRNELYEGYKTGAGVEAELLAQFDLAERAAQVMGLVVWGMVDFEADDALATGAQRYGALSDVDQVVVCSPDKDLAQCLRGDEIVRLDRLRDAVLDEQGVIERYGIEPQSIPDWLALVGDAADGIPGIPRWGAKSSSTVLGRFRHIAAIPDDPAQWDVKVRGAKGLAASLAERREEAELYRTLATLRRDVPLTEGLAELALREPGQDELAAFCAELGQPRLAERLWRARGTS
ncbi:MAG: flap endonuclease [Deltaproteobacteria bacterium]|nr:flap endonuclease [Deltaproteobacteria bacterium]